MTLASFDTGAAPPSSSVTTSPASSVNFASSSPSSSAIPTDGFGVAAMDGDGVVSMAAASSAASSPVTQVLLWLLVELAEPECFFFHQLFLWLDELPLLPLEPPSLSLVLTLALVELASSAPLAPSTRHALAGHTTRFGQRRQKQRAARRNDRAYQSNNQSDKFGLLA